MGLSTQYETKEPARAEVDAWRGPAVLEFGTPWCGYCQAAQPLIAAAFNDYERVHHVKIEDGPGRRLGRSYRVKLWPTLIFLRDGHEVTRVVRPTDEDAIREALAHIVDG